MIKPLYLALALTALSVSAYASPLLDEYEQLARQDDPSFSGFSSARGESFFLKSHNSGKAETPACTSCHSDSPLQNGHTRAGKSISPMAISKQPDRYSDPAKVEKWFRRNCNSVLGRPCNALEKGDFITFMLSR